MEDPQKKSLRLLLLHRLFNDSARGYRVVDLAERLGVSRRTIERDLLDLEAPPYSLPLDKDGWFHRLDRSRVIPLPPITLSREQAAVLYLGARLLMQHSGPLAPLAAGAVQRLAEALPAEMYNYLTRLAQPDHSGESGEGRRIFTDLVCGWIERRKVICRHTSLRGRTQEYTLAPYIFEPSAVGHAIYVRGRCDGDPEGQLRTLKLERIHATELTDDHFTHPTGDPLASLGAAWRIWDSTEAPVEVCLRFSGTAAKRVRETVWHPSQQLTDLDDGRCEWRARVAETQEMLPWIRGWGSEVEVIAPRQLRQKLAEDVRLSAQLYAEDRQEPGD